MHPVTEALGVCAASCGTSCQSLSSGLASFTQSSLCWVESALSCSSYRTFIANTIHARESFFLVGDEDRRGTKRRCVCIVILKITFPHGKHTKTKIYDIYKSNIKRENICL